MGIFATRLAAQCVRLRMLRGVVLLVWLALGAAEPLFAQGFDVVVANGRVLDPESGLDGVRHVFVVGRGRSLAAAGTGGLILKEAAHFPAEGMSSAAFRHGPFELLASHVFVLVFAGNAAASPLNRKLAADIQPAGNRAALVARDVLSGVFRLPAVPESLQPLMEILSVEMLTLALPALAGTEAGKFRLASKITSIE